MLITQVTIGQNNELKKYLNKKAPNLVFGEWITQQPELKGKFILVDFWATTCSPCRANIPELNHFQKIFKNDLVVVGLSYEPVEKVKKMKEPVIEYSVCTDIHYDTLREMRLQNIPYVLLIDPDGIVRWEGIPIYIHHKLTEEVIREIIENYKKNKK